MESFCNINIGVSKNLYFIFGGKNKKSILLFIKDELNWSKVTVKTFIMLEKDLFWINAVLWTFYSSKNFWKKKCFQHWK